MLTQIGLFTTSVLVALALAPAEASAAPKAKGAYGKPWRLHFESEFFGLSHVNLDGNDVAVDDEWTSVGFGIGRQAYIDGVPDGTLGFLGTFYSRPILSFGVGYAFSKERAIVGAKVALTVDGFDVGDDGHYTLVGGRFIPYFQWMFLPGSWIRPYVEARVGFGGSAHVDDDDEGPGGNAGAVHVIYPQVGLGGGVHFFPVDYFSIDLGLNFDYLAPHTRQTYRDPPPDDTEWDKYGDMINFGVLLGASVWF